MSQFKPYSIQHLPITSLTEITLPAENTLVYFWWQTLPLGHLWFEPKRKLTVAGYKKAIADSIFTSIHSYVGGQADDVYDLISAYINRENNVALESYLSHNLSKFLFENAEKHEHTISVVICTRNRPQAIETCIQSLMNATDTDFELIVVDNNPDNDLTQQVVAKYPSVKYILEPRKGLDIARNTGAKAASHSIIAYTDDDVVIDKNWIRNLKCCFNNPKTMAVTGMVIPVALNEWSQYVFERYWGFNKGYKRTTFDTAFFFKHLKVGVPVWEIGAGANMAFRKEVFSIVGYFDERLDVGAAGCSGDSEFWYRILAEGFNCYYDPQLIAYHQHRESREALYHQIFHYMRGQVASVLVQYENYGFAGEKRRVMQLLPKYYCSRIYSLFRGLHRGVNDYNKTLLTEIKGCVSGYKFYKSVQQQSKYQLKEN
ncbi:MAG TPA: glycosyltransferase [Flavipsychrobacter sp.]|nr:glycosyltransferase [Flavipsychrobacter sp.]